MNAVVPLHPHHQVPAPANYGVGDLERMARAFAQSKLFGVQNPEQALALCLVAQAEGRHPASAAQDYHIVQGRPAKKADAMLRDFISSGGRVEWHDLSDQVADATFSHPSGGSVRIAWDHDRAKVAGLGGKDMWKKFPRQMLRSRVVSEGVRTVCPGATSGMYVPEEVQEFAEPVRQSDDFDAAPQPRKSAHQARKDGDYERLVGGLRACTTEAELEAWAATERDALGAIPAGWAKELREEWVEMRAGFRAETADPFGLKVEAPASVDPGLWLEYLEDVCATIATAETEEQVRSAQVVNGKGLAQAATLVEGVAFKIAEASDGRLAAIAAGAQSDGD